MAFQYNKFPITESITVYWNVFLIILFSFPAHFLSQVNWTRYKKALMLATFNNTIVATGFSLAFYQLIKWRGNSCGYELPSFSRAIFDFLGFLICEEIGFYYTHRYYTYILETCIFPQHVWFIYK